MSDPRVFRPFFNNAVILYLYYLFQSQMIGLQCVLKCISTKRTAIRRRNRMYPVNFFWGTYMYNANMLCIS